jgi:hypothetical protein
MKRSLNTTETIAYLGIKRRSFERHILPLLRTSAIRIGTSVMYEITAIDTAWESFKIKIGSERPEVDFGEILWDVPKQPASKVQKLATTLTRSTKAFDFASAASKILNRPKVG